MEKKTNGGETEVGESVAGLKHRTGAAKTHPGGRMGTTAVTITECRARDASSSLVLEGGEGGERNVVGAKANAMQSLNRHESERHGSEIATRA